MHLESTSNFQSFDVIGIGNAIVDIIVKTEESFLVSNSLTKGSMKLINEKEAIELCSKIDFAVESSGGSVANTLAGLSQLGSQAGFIGRVRNDKLGASFTNEIKASGTFFNIPPTKQGPPTARCLIFVTSDAQRTMCTYLGASINLDPTDLDISLVQKGKFLYLEGYLWDNQSAKAAFLKAAEIAKSVNSKVALSLSDSFCVERHRNSFIDLVENNVDILFANEDEILALYQGSKIEEITNKIQGKCEVIAITMGEKGSKLITEDKIIDIEPITFGNVIDTTGAGDLYASGFLHGLIKNKSFKECGKIGSICAGHIINQIGTRTKANLSEIVRNNLQL